MRFAAFKGQSESAVFAVQRVLKGKEQEEWSLTGLNLMHSAGLNKHTRDRNFHEPLTGPIQVDFVFKLNQMLQKFS